MMRFKPILIIVILSLLPFLPVFTSADLPHTSDGGVQIPRMAAFYKAVGDIHIPVRWAGDLNYGYGLPLFNFIYQLPFFVTTILIALGINLVTAFKIALYLSYVFSGIFMFLFIKQLTGRIIKAIVVSVAYMFAPFRLVELLIRGALGGVYAYTFFPLILYGIVKLQNSSGKNGYITIACATALLVLSHNSLSLIFFSMAVLFSFIYMNDWLLFCRSMYALVFGLMLSAYFWIPAIAEHKFTYGDLFMKDLFKSHFPPLQNLAIPNFFYDKKLLTAEISVQVGILHVAFVILCIVTLMKYFRKSDYMTKINIFAVLILCVCVFLMSTASYPIWNNITLLRQFQFPWRFLAPVSFVTSLMALNVFHYPKLSKPKILYSICFLMVVTTIYYWYPRQGFDKVSEMHFWNYPLNTTYFGETDVIWSAGPAGTYPKNRFDVISGTATISKISKKTQKHTMVVTAVSTARLVDRTQYFPGWRVLIDHKPTPIQFQDPDWRGLITFEVPTGTHQVDVIFGESKIRLLANGISLTSFIFLGIYILKYNSKRRFLQYGS